MKPILKWPGGKSREVARVSGLIPDFDRYLEPFFGGGAMYFHLMPRRAAVNDNCRELMDFYRLVQAQDPALLACLTAYGRGFQSMLVLCRSRVTALLELYALLETGEDAARAGLSALLDAWMPELLARIPLPLDACAFRTELEAAVFDKLRRTARNQKKRSFSPDDLSENLITGFAGGFYLYFRRVYNDWNLGRVTLPEAERAANFFFVREYCYGSMFRYNANGAFNIPYGGMSYNQKDFLGKVQAMFRPELAAQLAGTTFCCQDFEDFLAAVQPTERDFLFLDPPYDTEFSDYEGAAFTRLDHARLALCLSRTKAKFLLIIKDTPYISGLYSQGFHVQRFDTQYTYNVRGRNNRNAEHLIVRNYESPGIEN